MESGPSSWVFHLLILLARPDPPGSSYDFDSSTTKNSSVKEDATGLSVKVMTTITNGHLPDFVPVLLAAVLDTGLLTPGLPSHLSHHCQVLVRVGLILCLHLKPSTEPTATLTCWPGPSPSLLSTVILDKLAFSNTPCFCAFRPLFILSLILAFPLRPEKIFPTAPGPALDLEMSSHLAL